MSIYREKRSFPWPLVYLIFFNQVPVTFYTDSVPTSSVFPGQTPTTPTSGQVIATPLAPGSQIPAGMEAFVSGGKTYCIPKATTQMAKLQAGGGVTQMIKAGQPTPVVQPKPQPQPASTPQPLTPVTPAAQTPQKQMVNVKPLGNNVVTFKGNQMIVSGPNVAEAQAVAKQLSSGAARLANLNGKQVQIVSMTVLSERIFFRITY